MNKDDSYKKVEALRKALQPQNFNCDPNKLSLRVSNERYAKDTAFDQQLSREDKRLLKNMGIAV